MLFEKEKYYKYIGTLEKSIVLSYIFIILLFTIIGGIIAGTTGKTIYVIAGIIIGIIIATEKH